MNRILLPVLAAMLPLMALAPASHANKGAPETFAPAKPLGAFALQDHRGAGFAKERFTGKWSLVLLGFTHCPDICPFTLNNLAEVVQQMSLRVRPERLPQVVFVGVDPDRDKPALGEYVNTFSPDFVGVTGEWDEIVKLVEDLEGAVRITGKEPGKDNYQVFHSAYVSVIDPEGRLAARLSPPMNPQETALFLATLMRDYAREIN